MHVGYIIYLILKHKNYFDFEQQKQLSHTPSSISIHTHSLTVWNARSIRSAMYINYNARSCWSINK